MESWTSAMYIGAHVSTAGGISCAVKNAVSIGARTFALDTRSKRKWESPPLAKEEIEAFKSACTMAGFDTKRLLPHGSYLINLGSPNAEVHRKSTEAFIDELERCHLLGLKLYNFHPGSTCGEISVEECLEKISDSINAAHADPRSGDVTVVVECMAGQGNTVGGEFAHLAAIIDRVIDKSRIGVCLDTCHVCCRLRHTQC
eukprot:Colp12_sorted_trinity150504_noHs@10342